MMRRGKRGKREKGDEKPCPPLFLIAGKDDDLHLGAAFRRADPVNDASAVGRKDNLDLIELPAERAGDAHLASGIGEFHLKRMGTVLVDALDRFLIPRHRLPRFFHARL